MVCWFALEFIVKDQTNFVMLTLLILIGSCVLGQNVAAQEKIKFPVGVGTKTIGTNMFWLATKKGFFDEFGLDVQPVLLRGTSITMQALVSESLYLARGSADATIGAAATGADLLGVGGVVNGLTQRSLRPRATRPSKSCAVRPSAFRC